MPELISGLTPGPLQAGGEGLLFLLFILFSVVTALLERRKRKKQAEESRTASAAPAGPLTDEEDEETGSWPFPMGGDPFDLPKPKQRPERRPASETAGEATAESESAAPASRRTLIEQMEDDAKEAKRLQKTEAGDGYNDAAPPDTLREMARAAERPVQEVQPRRRERELAQERVELDQQQPRKKRRSRWLLTPKTARDALVYTEILGRPKSEREGEDFG